MIAIERHIEILLLDNDCVIVPGLGGFIAHNVGYSYDERDMMLLPPKRTLGFNQKIAMNDSLLAQSYAEAYDISFPEAAERIARDVEEMRFLIERDGSYELADIGVLSLNDDGNYEFEPCEAGILTPELYGLSGVEIPKLYTSSAAESVETVVTEPKKLTAPVVESQQPKEKTAEIFPLNSPVLVGEEKDEQPERTISIRVSAIRNAIAVACAIIAFFVFATPLNTGTNADSLQMSAIDTGNIYGAMAKDIAPAKDKRSSQKQSEELTKPSEATENMTLAPKETEEQGNAPECKADKKVSEPAAKSLQTAETDYYCVVLASRITRSNAEAYVAQLQKQGIADACILAQAGNGIKVVCGKTSTEGSAYAKANKMRDKEDFKDVWVYHVR